MKKLILGVILAFSAISCTQDGVPGKDGVNGTNGTNGTNASTTGQGKTHIFITGNITNTQAAAQITQELGSNTTHISIVNTTGLTVLDLSALTSVWELIINDNVDLTTVNLNGLKNISNLSFYNDNNLQSVSLNNLTSSSSIILNFCPVTSLNLPLLKYGTLNIYSNYLTSLNAPSLAIGNVSMYSAQLTSLSMPSLTTGSVSVAGASLTSLSLPLLTTGNVNISDTSLISLDLPSLLRTTTNSYSLFVINNKKLTSVNIPKLISVSGDVFLYNNSFPSSEINKLLNLCNNKFTFIGLKNIYLFGQTPKAPPTGQGIIDKNALIAKGYAVTTD